MVPGSQESRMEHTGTNDRTAAFEEAVREELKPDLEVVLRLGGVVGPQKRLHRVV